MTHGEMSIRATIVATFINELFIDGAEFYWLFQPCAMDLRMMPLQAWREIWLTI